jgi:hypothetical protein
MAEQQIERPKIALNDRNWVEAQKYVGKELQKRGIETAVLPGGIAIDARAWRGFQHSVNIKVFVMAEPEKLLKDPQPGCKYCWRPREDSKHSTEGLIRTHKLYPVEFDRIIPDADGVEDLYEYAGSVPGDTEVRGFVACGDYQLFEVPPRTAYKWFDEPVDRTFAELAGLKPKFQRSMEEFAERHGEEVLSADIKISQKQTMAQESRHPITRPST